MRLLERPTAFSVITGRASSHQILPGVITSQVARQDMVDGHYRSMLPAVLAGIAVTAHDFPLGELDMRTRALDHMDQADYRRAWESLRHRFNFPATIHDQAGFSAQNQRDRPPGIANIDRLEICVED